MLYLVEQYNIKFSSVGMFRQLNLYQIVYVKHVGSQKAFVGNYFVMYVKQAFLSVGTSVPRRK